MNSCTFCNTEVFLETVKRVEIEEFQETAKFEAVFTFCDCVRKRNIVGKDGRTYHFLVKKPNVIYFLASLEYGPLSEDIWHYLRSRAISIWNKRNLIKENETDDVIDAVKYSAPIFKSRIALESGTFDSINPQHYQDISGTGKQAIDFIQHSLSEDEFKGYLKGNALKYRFRAGNKGNAGEDLKKESWYLTKLKDLGYSNG